MQRCVPACGHKQSPPFSGRVCAPSSLLRQRPRRQQQQQQAPRAAAGGELPPQAAPAPAPAPAPAGAAASGAAGDGSGQPQPGAGRSRGAAARAAGFIAAHGHGAFLAYISVSNALSVGLLSSAWLLFTRTRGVTPLHDWPHFLLFFAPLYAAQHAARPLKLAAGLALSPLGGAALDGVARLLRLRSKTAALAAALAVEAVLLLAVLGGVVLRAASLVAGAV